MDGIVKHLGTGDFKFSIRRFMGFDAAGMPLVALGANDTAKMPGFSLVAPLSCGKARKLPLSGWTRKTLRS